MTRRCADCGAHVSKTPTGRWGRRRGVGTWEMTCRSEIEGDRLISADYHYVKGEVQRHFPPPKEGHESRDV